MVKEIARIGEWLRWIETTNEIREGRTTSSGGLSRPFVPVRGSKYIRPPPRRVPI